MDAREDENGSPSMLNGSQQSRLVGDGVAAISQESIESVELKEESKETPEREVLE